LLLVLLLLLAHFLLQLSFCHSQLPLLLQQEQCQATVAAAALAAAAGPETA
jgi:hypothetical protein